MLTPVMSLLVGSFVPLLSISFIVFFFDLMAKILVVFRSSSMVVSSKVCGDLGV